MTLATRDQKLYDKLIELKRHLRTCARCISAKKARDFVVMCNQGLRLTTEAAWQYDDLIKLKIAAHKHPGNIIYACPNRGLHGKAFELTAHPYVATGIQDALF